MDVAVFNPAQDLVAVLEGGQGLVDAPDDAVEDVRRQDVFAELLGQADDADGKRQDIDGAGLLAGPPPQRPGRRWATCFSIWTRCW